MKKPLLFLLVFAMLVSCFTASISATEPDGNGPVAQAIKGTPVIDGEVDEIWTTAQKNNIGAVSEDHSVANAAFRTMWDENYLYVLYEVEDHSMGDQAFEKKVGAASIWQRDSICLALAPSYSREANANAPSFHYMIGAFGTTANYKDVPRDVFIETTTGEGEEAVTTPNFFITYQTDENGKYTGYTFEMKINLKSNYADMAMEAGTCIGFSASLNDNDYNDNKGAGGRKTVKMWSAGGDFTNKDSDKGTLKFVTTLEDTSEPVDKNPITYAAKGTPVIDGTIDEIWANAKEERIENLISDPKPEATPAVATFRTMWDEDYLYLLYVVNDETMVGPNWEEQFLGGNLWRRDGLSITFSPNYNREVTGGQVAPAFWFIIGAFGNTANFNNVAGNVFIGDVGEDGKVLTDEDGNPLHPNYAISYLQNEAGDYFGYVMELKINLKARYDAIEMKEGTRIGFDTFLNDNYGGKSAVSSDRDANLEWGISKGNSHKNDAQKGTIQLVNAVENPEPLPNLDDMIKDPEPEPGDDDDGEATRPPVVTKQPSQPTEPTGENTTTGESGTDDKGCASAIGSSAIFTLALLSLGVAAVTKKRKS